MGELTESELFECRACKAKSPWKAGFVDTRNIIHGPHKLCGTCWQYNLKFRWVYFRAATWVIALIWIGYFLTRSVTPALVAAVALYAITYLSVVVHELGHALTAAALRVRVIAFSLGGGLHAKILRFRRTFVFVGPSPVEGLVLLSPSSPRHYRTRMALILAAGSLVNLLFGFVGLYVLANTFGLSHRLAEIWTFINFLLVLNLLPWVSRGPFGALSSDGKQLIALFKSSDEDIAKQIGNGKLAEAHLAFLAGDFALAHDVIRRDRDSLELSGNGRVLVTAVLISSGKLDEGIEACRRYLAIDGNEPAERALLMNNLAWALIDPTGGNPTPARLAEADELSSQAFEYLPMQSGVRGTRGTVLVARGECRDAVPLLSDKRFRLDSRSQRATVKTSLALALAGLGETARAEKALREARALDPTNVYAQRARQQLGVGN